MLITRLVTHGWLDRSPDLSQLKIGNLTISASKTKPQVLALEYCMILHVVFSTALLESKDVTEICFVADVGFDRELR